MKENNFNSMALEGQEQQGAQGVSLPISKQDGRQTEEQLSHQQDGQQTGLHENEMQEGVEPALQATNHQESQEAGLQEDADGRQEEKPADLREKEEETREEDDGEDLLPVEFFLDGRYELRTNVLSGKTEVRTRGREGREPGEWHHLDQKMLNTITLAARKVLPKERALKTQLADAIFSERTPVWDPIKDYLEHLPEWDGKDRVSHLFGRLPGVGAEELAMLAVWLRSAVAHWLQLDQMHANESVLTLIGDQGCGKSTFLRRLLPEELREYYLDHVNLSNKFDKEMALTNNLIVNIDELDQIRPSRQAELKQMLSKVRVNGRMIYGKEQTDRARYASFAATTNNRHPLRDRTGSRRYLCIEITSGQLIDNETPIEYEQVYAQVLTEVRNGKCYWFDEAQTREIQRWNIKFQDTLDLETMVSQCFRRPDDGEYTPALSIDEILKLIGDEYPAVRISHATRVQLGMTLTRMGFERKDIGDNHMYFAFPLRQRTVKNEG